MENIYFCHSKNNFDKEIRCIFNAAMDDFLTIDEDGAFLLLILNSILNNESTGTEVSSLYLSSDPEGVDEKFKTEGVKDFIIIGYLNDYVIFDLNFGVSIIIEWCGKYTGNIDGIDGLCQEVITKKSIIKL